MDNPADKVETNFKYSPDRQSAQRTAPTNQENSTDTQSLPDEANEPLFSWKAPDSFSNNKSFSWYLVLILLTAGVSAGIYFLTKDKITTGVFVASGLLVGIYGSKKPKIVNYQINKYGFHVNGKLHEFGNYRSFSIVHHGQTLSAVLTPLKRFMPYMYIYFGGDMEQQVTSTLADVLPIEPTHNDVVDRITRRIGF